MCDEVQPSRLQRLFVIATRVCNIEDDNVPLSPRSVQCKALMGLLEGFGLGMLAKGKRKGEDLARSNGKSRVKRNPENESTGQRVATQTSTRNDAVVQSSFIGKHTHTHTHADDLNPESLAIQESPSFADRLTSPDNTAFRSFSPAKTDTFLVVSRICSAVDAD